ncbi:MAG: hypothetical protein GC179_07085 [Anaerolineaceae bacterium]|nr:hypothetical protein [Anaerolineaceae bacterium]
MTLLHEETLARYQELLPSEFMEYVIFGTLRDHMYTVYTVINVYTKIVLSLPSTIDLRLTYVPNTVLQIPTELREIMRNIQLCAVEAYNLMQIDIPRDSDSIEHVILQFVNNLRQPIETIDRWAAAIEGDIVMKSWVLHGLRDKTPSQVASEIRQYMFDTNQVLLFAQAYALWWSRKSPRLT